MKQRLDQELLQRKLVATRSQAENYIKLGRVKVNDLLVTKAGRLVTDKDKLQITSKEQYVSRAAMKLESVAEDLALDFKGKTVLDIGSSTGGFTDYCQRQGAKRVIAVELGTNQMHPSLRSNPKVELYEKTDIRDFITANVDKLYSRVDVVVADVSFISLKEILPSVVKISSNQTVIIAMVKPQFEAGNIDQKHNGVIKNDRVRREIFKDFELWTKKLFNIRSKKDSDITGAKGNRERFYVLTKIS